MMNHKLKIIGPASEKWLHTACIYTPKDLEKIGSIEAYRTVKLYGFNASLNLHCALEGAIRDLHWTAPPENMKTKLKAAVRSLPKD